MKYKYSSFRSGRHTVTRPDFFEVLHSAGCQDLGTLDQICYHLKKSCALNKYVDHLESMGMTMLTLDPTLLPSEKIVFTHQIC